MYFPIDFHPIWVYIRITEGDRKEPRKERPRQTKVGPDPNGPAAQAGGCEERVR